MRVFATRCGSSRRIDTEQPIGRPAIDHRYLRSILGSQNVRPKHRDTEESTFLRDHPPRVHARIMRQEPCHEFREQVRLEKCRTLCRHGESRCVRLTEPEGCERCHIFEDFFDDIAPVSELTRPFTDETLDTSTTIGITESTTQQVSFRGVAPRQRREHAHHLLVVDDDSERLGKHGQKRRVRHTNRLFSVAARNVRTHHVGSHRAGSEERDLCHQVTEACRLQSPKKFSLPRRFDLKYSDRVRGSNQVVRCWIVMRNHVERERAVIPTWNAVLRCPRRCSLRTFPSHPVHKIETVPHRRQHPHTENIEFEHPKRRNVILVELTDRIPVGTQLHRRTVKKSFISEQDPTGVHREMPWHPIDTRHEFKQRSKSTNVEATPHKFRKALKRVPDIACTETWKLTCYIIDLFRREPERSSDASNCGTRLERLEHAHRRDTISAVARDDQVVDIFTTVRFDIEIDIRQLVTVRVHEPFEGKTILHRIDVTDTKRETHERPCSRTTTGHKNAGVTHITDHVRDRKKEILEALGGDDSDLTLESTQRLLTRYTETSKEARLRAGDECSGSLIP